MYLFFSSSLSRSATSIFIGGPCEVCWAIPAAVSPCEVPPFDCVGGLDGRADAGRDEAVDEAARTSTGRASNGDALIVTVGHPSKGIRG